MPDEQSSPVRTPVSPESCAEAALAEIQTAASVTALKDLKVKYLGKKSPFAEFASGFGKLSPEDRKEAGMRLHAARGPVEEALEAALAAAGKREREASLLAERLDVTLPAPPVARGVLHPVTRAMDELTAIFAEAGFVFADGPEAEDDYHNFTALNIPPDHPARQMQDTFYLAGAAEGESPYVLRTHTSSVQIRALTGITPPCRILSAGRVFRSDYDATHTPMFHQMEGVVIGEDIHMGHLKGCLLSALRTFFAADDLRLRFRPSFFPFTEPSAEADISCTRGKDKITVGAGVDWMEVLGCGMMHPNVLKACGIDPEKYQGFAFGLGLERLAMLKYGAPDLRRFFNSDVRWLRHYGFAATSVPSGAEGSV